uniref:helix-turn-helix domain-containing protein n=1 Tax=Kutzneria viridogrisea TaxID=47990 RepID=UPI00160494BC
MGVWANIPGKGLQPWCRPTGLWTLLPGVVDGVALCTCPTHRRRSGRERGRARTPGPTPGRSDQLRVTGSLSLDTAPFPRGVLGFLRAGRWSGTTPMGYLCQVRLHHAHQDLLTADPTRGDSVAAIARRWGFTTPARFTARYRDTYGHPPHRDLAHEPL